jgi:polyphenol oxidase
MKMELSDLRPGDGAALPGGCSLRIRGLGGQEPGENDNVVFLHQVHGSTILREPRGGEEADGMIVRRGPRHPGLKAADCVPFFLLGAEWLGAAHAGWRGLAAGVIGKLVEDFPGEPFAAVIGPCICGLCYSVGEAVREAVLSACPGAASGSGRLDLRSAAIAQAAARGLGCPVLVSPECTCCSGGLHSWRRTGSAGRNLVWIQG